MNNLVRSLRNALCVPLLAGVAACGGGVYVDATVPAGPPPDISIVSSSDVAVRGDPIRLIGAVSASNGVDYVSFFRIDFGVATPLGTVFRPPLQWDTSIPINAGSTVSYYARACDALGLCTNSNVVSVAVFP